MRWPRSWSCGSSRRSWRFRGLFQRDQIDSSQHDTTVILSAAKDLKAYSSTASHHDRHPERSAAESKDLKVHSSRALAVATKLMPESVA